MKRVLLLIALLASTPARAELAKWLDAEGRVHYGDRPPTGRSGRSEPLRGTVSVGDGMTMVATPDKAERTASDEFATAITKPRKGEIWIYTTPRCGYCRRAKEHLRQRGIAFQEKDITANAEWKAELRALGSRGVPVTLSGNQRADGYQEGAFNDFLKSAGW